MRRQIFVGDVQGCYAEFCDLLKLLQVRPESDALHLVGDVINRGPGSDAALEYLLKNPKVRVVMGNHEWNFLQLKSVEQGLANPDLAKTTALLQKRWTTYFELMASWPSYIEAEDWIMVHAGLWPDPDPEKTPLKQRLKLRTLPREAGGIELEGQPWYHHHRGHKMVIFGHWATNGLVHHGRMRGLDSGCVYGGRLSALVLPEDEIVSVPARQRWYDPIREKECW